MSGADHVGALEQRVRALLEGLRGETAPLADPVRVGGHSINWGEMLARVEAMHATFAAVHEAYTAYREAVSNRRLAMKAHRSELQDHVVFMMNLLGKDNPRLPQFGIPLPKGRRPLTAEANAISRAKAAATRRARRTLGRRQRQSRGKPPAPMLQVIGADGLPLEAVTAATEGEPPPG